MEKGAMKSLVLVVPLTTRSLNKQGCHGDFFVSAYFGTVMKRLVPYYIVVFRMMICYLDSIISPWIIDIQFIIVSLAIDLWTVIVQYAIVYIFLCKMSTNPTVIYCNLTISSFSTWVDLWIIDIWIIIYAFVFTMCGYCLSYYYHTTWFTICCLYHFSMTKEVKSSMTHLSSLA